MAAISVFGSGPALAKKSGVENAGRIVAFALPAAAAGISAWKGDWDGLLQLTVVTGATLGTSLLLKQVVHEDRPDHSDRESFPSDTAALAFAPAQVLWDRYGWRYGVPAYAAAAFVGYSRVDAKKHHWWDVAASAGIAFGYSYFLTDRYQRDRGLYSGLYATPEGATLAVNYRF